MKGDERRHTSARRQFAVAYAARASDAEGTRQGHSLAGGRGRGCGGGHNGGWRPRCKTEPYGAREQFISGEEGTARGIPDRSEEVSSRDPAAASRNWHSRGQELGE